MFVNHRALAISPASSGSGIGCILFPTIFNNLQPRIGFGWTVRAAALIILAFLLTVKLILTQRPRPAGPRKLFSASAWRDSPYILVAITSLLGYVGVYIPFFYMHVIGRVVPGLVADGIVPFNTLIPYLLASGILAICWNAVHSEVGLIVSCSLFGFISASLDSLGPATIMNVTPDMSVLGVWMGMMLVPLEIVPLTGALIRGAILDGIGGWLGLEIFCGFVLIGSSVALAGSRIMKTGVVLKARY